MVRSLHLPAIRQEKLANGLDIYLVEEHETPVVTSQIWFRVGSAHEQEGHAGRPGTTGVSHFLEHLLFRGTERFPDCFGAVYARGGQLNAWTWYDATCFWEKMPAGNLPFAFSLEADRLKNLRFDLQAFERERQVVRNERLLRSVNDPSGAIDERLHARAFRTSPYRWPVVGWPQDLISVTPAQIWDYFRSHYCPTNAFIVVVGDFDPTEALQAAEQEFGSLPPERAPARLPLPEPEQQGERRDFVEKATSTGLLQLAFQAPSGDDPDYLAFEVLHFLLGRGKSSRLQRRLIYCADPVATSLSASLWTMREPYLYHLELHVAPGRANREAERRFDQVIDEVRHDLVSEAELRKAVSGVRSELVRSCLDTQGKANLIGFSLITTGRPDTLFARLAEAEQLTPEDLRRVAQRYLVPERRTVVASVNPCRLDDLTTERWSGEVGPATKLLLDATAVAALRHDLGLEQAVLSEDATALTLLEERLGKEAAAIGAAATDAETEAWIEQRRGVLARAQEKLQTRLHELAEKLEALRTRHAGLRAEERAGVLAQFAAAALGDGPLPAVADLQALRPEEDAALLLLHRARLDLRAGRAGEAQDALRAVAELTARASQNAKLQRAADLAWEWQVV